MSNEILLRLREFHPADANIIAGWLKSEYLMRQWCADRYSRYPVTADDINSYHDKYIDGHSSIALTMVDAAKVIGYITLRKPSDQNSEWRLGFVIVDDAKRGLGLGKKLVSMAIDYAHKELDATKVSLGVFEIIHLQYIVMKPWDLSKFKEKRQKATLASVRFGIA